MKSLQHDVAMGAMQAIIEPLEEYIPSERRLTVKYLLYYSIKAAVEQYELMAERRERRLRPSKN